MEKELSKRISTSFVLITILLAMFLFNFFSIYILIITSSLAFIEFSKISKKLTKSKSFILFYNILFILYIFFFSIIFFFASTNITSKIVIFSLLLISVSSDIGGYIIGKIIKGPKLIKLSPNKTISGSIGSIIFANITGVLIVLTFSPHIFFEVFIISTIVSILTQIGDIFFSSLKRKSKIKDYGEILPGHGGILDRIDGILFGVPLGYILIFLI